MKNKHLLIFLVLIYFTPSYAGMHKLNYTLPNEGKNWIRNVFISDEIIIIVHRLGITISSDGGLSFREAAVPALTESSSRDSIGAFIVNDKKTFLISVNNQHLISNNYGASFEIIKHSPGYGFFNVVEDSVNFYCKTNWHYHEIHEEAFFISADKGRTWKEVIVGSNDSENVTDIFMHNNILSVFTLDLWSNDNKRWKLYLSKDHGNTYEEIEYNKNLITQREKNADLFLQHLNTLNMDLPMFKALTGAGNYYFNYNKDNLNAYQPLDGIFYERPSGGTINANLAPRKGGFINASKTKIYYSSFKDIWVER